MDKESEIVQVMDVDYFLEVNKDSSAQDIIINLYKLNNNVREKLLRDENGVLKNKILYLLENSNYDKYIFILKNHSLYDFFNSYGKDFILSLDLPSQYSLLEENLSYDALINIVPNLRKEVIDYFFEEDKRALYLFDRFDISTLVKRGIKFSNNILKKKEFFDMLKSTSFMEFRKNINNVEKVNNPIIIEERLEEYYRELINDYNVNSGLFVEYEEILGNLELLFAEDNVDTYILNEEIRSIIRDNVIVLDDASIVISDKDKLIQILKKETNKKISEIVIDAIFKDNIYNVWLNTKEMLRYNELLNDDEKVLDNEKVDFYKMIMDFDRISSDDKINLYKFLDGKNFNLIFYTDLRNVKDKAYDKIRRDIFKPLEHKEFINEDYSNNLGVKVYDLRNRNYTMLVRVLSNAFVSKGHHNKDSYSIISNKNNFVIKQDDPNIILYGYSSFDNDIVLHMFESDSFSLLNTDNKLVNRIMTSRELAESNASYSEIQLINKKSDEGKYVYDILKPDFIISFDRIKEKEIEESKRLGIPIVMINKVRLKDNDKNHSSFNLRIDSYDSYENVKKSAR